MRRFLSCTFLAVLFATGCHRAPQPASQAASTSNYKVYKLRGKIVATDASTGEITVDHEAIPGFMDAMTMPYKLKNPGIMSDLHPGDVITADVFVSQGADADVYLDNIVVIAQGKPDYRPKVSYHVPAPGDVVPNFLLRNQDGRTIALNHFHGKDLLITFIYTRCPLPNFCPLVTHNFAVINRELIADPAVYRKTHLLCVTFDPEHDTPARLRAYGATYIGSDAK
ncbi:MAG: SCO family protein, partial [Terracidiphilus sp.]